MTWLHPQRRTRRKNRNHAAVALISCWLVFNGHAGHRHRGAGVVWWATLSKSPDDKRFGMACSPRVRPDAVFCMLLLGALSDKIGRLPVLIFSGMAVNLLATRVAPSAWLDVLQGA